MDLRGIIGFQGKRIDKWALYPPHGAEDFASYRKLIRTTSNHASFFLVCWELGELLTTAFTSKRGNTSIYHTLVKTPPNNLP